MGGVEVEECEMVVREEGASRWRAARLGSKRAADDGARPAERGSHAGATPPRRLARPQLN